MKKQYPANLLKAIRLNEICGAAIDYDALNADQQGGLANLLAQLTEQERFVLDKYYCEGISMKALADQYQVNQNRTLFLFQISMSLYSMPFCANNLVPSTR